MCTSEAAIHAEIVIQGTSNHMCVHAGGTCGGLLSDIMGLGKTLQTLMLVMARPAPEGWAINKLPRTLQRSKQHMPITRQ